MKMKMNIFFYAFAACLPLARSFQNAKTVAVGAIPSTSFSSSRSPSSLFVSDSDASPDNDEAELKAMKQQFSELTASLSRAKQRQMVAQEDVELTRAKREDVISKTEEAIASLKRSLR